MREDWIEIELGHVCDKAKKVKRNNMPSDESFIYIDIGGIDNHLNQIVDYKIYKWKEAPSRAQQIVQVGDVLFSTVRTYLKNIAQVSNAKYQNQICSSGFTVIRGKVGVLHPKYIFYHSLFEGFLQPLNDLQTGTSYPAVRDNDVFAQKIPLSPLPEQRAIVAKIEQLFSELDNGIANLKAAKDKLEIYRAAVLHYAFENDSFEELQLEEVVEDHMIGIVRALKDQNSDGHGVPYIKMNNVNLTGQVDLEDIVWVEVDSKELEKYRLQNDDILINTRNSFELVGKTGIVSGIKSDYVFNNNLLRLRIKEEYNPKFIAYQLISPLVRNQMGQGKKATTNVCALYQRNIFPLKIRTTDFEKQNEIVQEIESRLSVCDNILANIEEGLEKSEALRQSILKQAFEGKLLSEEELEACKHEPDWEPAEQLLARIKNGNETSVKKKKAPAKQAPKKKIHHVEYYKRTLLAAEIVWQLHRQPTLGHLKLQKLIYLCQESGNMQLPTNFLQQAAGPYDPQMARSIDKQLKTKKWFAYRKNELLKYEPLEKAGGHQTDFKKYYAKDINNIQKVIELFRTAKSDQIEIVATLYACWKKIILEKVIFSENLLIRRFYEWSEEKSKYPESRVKKAVEWMREKGIVPVNAGKQTIDE